MSDPIDKELQNFVQKYGFVIPDRGMKEAEAADVTWRNEKPDYRSGDLLYLKGKSKNHKVGSLEIVTENLIKKWEMELTHFAKAKDITSMKIDEFKLQVNNDREITKEELLRAPSYNWLLESMPKELYDSSSHTFESSHELFRKAFVGGFPWEVLEVFSKPPKIAFVWRHWGTFNGEYKGRKGTGEVIELYGFTIGTVTDDLKLIKVEIFYKPEGFLRALEGEISPSELLKGKAFLGSCCPIHQDNEKKE